ncbi:MAG: glycoside hydrolase family 2 sugar binding protein [Gemmatimonadetes bacterium]|nr:glycoside hydrolase family 2 sugar binding protein [Gemmatimonadota bacterium]
MFKNEAMNMVRSLVRAGKCAMLIALVAVPVVAQQSPLAWPAATRDTKPWTRWWWLGSAVNKPGLSAQLAELSAAGFGGVEVTVIYGARGADSAYIPYLSPAWVDMIAHVASETRRRGMGLDLPQGSGWRMGGPSVQPADVNLSLVIHADTVAGGSTWTTYIATRQVQAITARSATGEHVSIPLTSPVRWQAPEGRWIVYTAETRFSGDNVKRPAPGGEGPSLDPFSAGATARYLAMFAERTAALPKGAIRSYFHDSFEYTGDASAGVFAEFRKRRGYDPGAELPALAGVGETDHVARVKSDYRQTLDEMLLEHFVEQLTTWSHGRGALMREQAHGSPGNILDLYAASDIPETEIFGVLRGPDGDPLINKFASSAAHVGGHRLASAESFTWLGEHFTATLDDIRQAADRMFLAGINHLVYHGTAYSPGDAAWPGWQFYASTEFNPRNAFWPHLPAFNQYVTRVQSFLQGGQPDNDVLLYWPIADNWHDASGKRMDFRIHDPKWFHDTPFGKLARTMYESGLGVDYVSDRLLVKQVRAAGAQLHAGSAGYSALVVPATEHMPPETFARMLALARDGATIAFVGTLPTDVPGLAALAARRAQLAAMEKEIPWRDAGNGVQVAQIGKGRLFMGGELEPLLLAAGVQRDPLAGSSLGFIRRKSATGRQYFVVASRAVEGWVALAGHPSSVALMDPMSGRTGLARLRTVSGRAEAYVEAYVEADSGQSLIIRTFDTPAKGAQWAYVGKRSAPVALRGRWSVAFVEGGPVLPQAYAADSVSPFTGRGDADADRLPGRCAIPSHLMRPMVRAVTSCRSGRLARVRACV